MLRKSLFKNSTNIFLFLFLLLFPQISISQAEKQEEDKINALLNEGMELYRQGEYGKAIGKFFQINVRTKDEKVPIDSFFFSSLCLFALNDIEGSKNFVKETLRRDPLKEVSSTFHPIKYVEIFNKIKYVEMFNQIQEDLKRRLAENEKIIQEESVKNKLKNEPIPKRNLGPLQSVDVSPIVIKSVTPKIDWNQWNQKQWENIKLVVNFFITEKGDVEEAMIIYGYGMNLTPQFRKAVIDAAKKWKFMPALKEGKVVKVWKPIIVRISRD